MSDVVKARILLVEDEPQMLDICHYILTGAGYTRLARATLTDLWTQAGQEARFPSAPPVAQLPPSAAPQPRGSTIYVFRTTDGRVFIVDDPRKVAGLEGEWIQGKP